MLQINSIFYIMQIYAPTKLVMVNIQKSMEKQETWTLTRQSRQEVSRELPSIFLHSAVECSFSRFGRAGFSRLQEGYQEYWCVQSVAWKAPITCKNHQHSIIPQNWPICSINCLGPSLDYYVTAFVICDQGSVVKCPCGVIGPNLWLNKSHSLSHVSRSKGLFTNYVTLWEKLFEFFSKFF